MIGTDYWPQQNFFGGERHLINWDPCWHSYFHLGALIAFDSSSRQFAYVLVQIFPALHDLRIHYFQHNLGAKVTAAYITVEIEAELEYCQFLLVDFGRPNESDEQFLISSPWAVCPPYVAALILPTPTSLALKPSWNRQIYRICDILFVQLFSQDAFTPAVAVRPSFRLFSLFSSWEAQTWIPAHSSTVPCQSGRILVLSAPHSCLLY